MRLVWVVWVLCLGVPVWSTQDMLETSLIHKLEASLAHKNAQHPKVSKKSKGPAKWRNAAVLHKWIYSSVFLTAYFSDGHYKQGYGLLLKNGHYLTSSELAFDRGMYAKTVMARMQDDSASVLICVAQLRLRAIDRNRGLSLFNTYVFTNDYCEIRPESYYHKRIYTKYGQDLLLLSKHPKGASMLYYPQVSLKDGFEIKSMHIPSAKKSDLYPIKSSLENMYGRPFFSQNGVFMGMVTANNAHLLFANREIVQEFLRDLRRRKIF